MSEANTTINREDLLRRIKALQSKTTAAGCTEAEAMAAAALVARLVDRYGFSNADLNAPEKVPVTEDTYLGPDKTLGRIFFLSGTVASYCDCKAWSTVEYHNGKRCEVLKFFGQEADVAMAIYLMHLLRSSMFSCWVDYRPSRPQHIKLTHARRTFEAGWMRRVHERLVQMKAARNGFRDEHSGKTGRDLVLVKNAVVTEAFAKRAAELRMRTSTRSGPKARSADVYAAGRAAGDKVQINPGVAGSAVKRLS